ncbi:MAG: hypothetical protein HQM14_07870 [SAR324 cluster bacterium]|nr:hypothetical protein [SAR324 cluster bacterium]
MFSLLKQLLIICLAGLAACQTPTASYVFPSSSVIYPPASREPSPFLYPSADQIDIQFLCNHIYSIPKFEAKPYTGSSVPRMLVVTESTVTVYFSNNYTQTAAKPDSVELGPGYYQCL